MVYQQILLNQDLASSEVGGGAYGGIADTCTKILSLVSMQGRATLFKCEQMGSEDLHLLQRKFEKWKLLYWNKNICTSFVVNKVTYFLLLHLCISSRGLEPKNAGVLLVKTRKMMKTKIATMHFAGTPFIMNDLWWTMPDEKFANKWWHLITWPNPVHAYNRSISISKFGLNSSTFSVHKICYIILIIQKLLQQVNPLFDKLHHSSGALKEHFLYNQMNSFLKKIKVKQLVFISLCTFYFIKKRLQFKKRIWIYFLLFNKTLSA